MYKFQCVNNKVEVFLYSLIARDGGYGLTAKDVISAIKGAGDVSVIDLHINSDGGDVFAAQSMYNYLKQHKAKKNVYIDGLAASAASIVAMCGTVIMPPNAMLMIHNPAGYVEGESDDMREMAKVLDKIRDQIAGIYAAKTGMSLEEITKLMDAETWLTADEALAMGFADKVIEARNEKETPTRTETQKEFDGTGAGIHATSEEISGAVEAERERIRELDLLNAPGCEEIIRMAKYETFKDAKEVAYELLTSRKFQDLAVNRTLDALDVSDVAVSVKAPDEAKSFADLVSKKINERRGY